MTRLLGAERADIAATLRRMEALRDSGRRVDDILVLTHGDPNLSNIIKDGSGRLHFIDWGDVALATRERDLVFFAGPHFAPFLDAYARVAGKVVLREDAFAFYLYHWILQEIADYGTLILAGDMSDIDVAHAWAEIQRYVPIRHGGVESDLRAIRAAARHVGAIYG